MATIRRKGSFQWHVQVRKKGYPSQTRTLESKQNAEVWARMVESEMDRGVFVSRAEAEKTTLNDAFDRYAREILPTKKGYRADQVRLNRLKSCLGAYTRFDPLEAVHEDPRLYAALAGDAICRYLDYDMSINKHMGMIVSSVIHSANKPAKKSTPRKAVKSAMVAAKAAVAKAPAKERLRKLAPGEYQRRFRQSLRTAALDERIQMEREGVPPTVVLDLINELEVSATQFQHVVGMPKATFAKKMAKRELIGGTPGQSVIGLLELINKIEDMLNPKDNRDALNFDIERWVGEWITRPQPALGGKCPADLMDTQPGREKVKQVLGSLQSGVYL